MNTRKIYVRVGILSAIICLCIALVSLIKKNYAKTDGTIYEFTIAKKGIMIDNATCYAWIPEDAGIIRGVIVHLQNWKLIKDMPVNSGVSGPLAAA